VRVQVIPYQDDLLRVWVVVIKQRLDLFGQVDGGFRWAHRNLAPAAQGFGEHEMGDTAQALVFIVDAPGLSGLHRQWSACFADQLGGLLVETDHRSQGIVRALIHRQHIFHGGDKRRILLGWNHPILTAVRFEFVFLSARITVGAEMESTISKATNSSASRRSVQRAWPAGGSLQAICSKRAWPSPSRIGVRDERACRLRSKAASKPWVTKRRRTLYTVCWAHEKAEAVWAAGHFGPSASDFSRILACLILYAAALPVLTIWVSRSRSSGVNRTMYRLFMSVLPKDSHQSVRSTLSFISIG